MEKKFQNLSIDYRLFLDDVNNKLSLINLNKEINLKKLENYKNEINEIGYKYNIHNSDINRLLLQCTNNHNGLNLLKDFTLLRNIKLLEKTIKNSKYLDFINNLKEKEKLNSKEIDLGLTKFWNKYLTHWDGFWKFIDYSGGNIKKIEILDPKDYQEFIACLSKDKK